jgi:hypothetical protein
MTFKVTKALATDVIKAVKPGLTCGLGEPEPGKMCVEAAVCYAMGIEHSDEPPCVDAELRNLKINLNDMGYWLNNKSRAKGLVRLAIAQLGTNNKFDYAVFQEKLEEAFHAFFLRNFSLFINKENFYDWDSIIQAAQVDNDVQEGLDTLLGWLSNPKQTDKLMHEFCEDVVQVLKKMKAPGTKFLYLTEQ